MYYRSFPITGTIT